MRRQRQQFRVTGVTSGSFANALGQELIRLDGVREVEIVIDPASWSMVTIVATRLLEAPEVDAAVEVVRGQLLVAG